MAEIETKGIFEELMNFKDPRKDSVGGSTTGSVKLKPSEQLLLDIENSGYTMRELTPILTTRGNQLIVSCAGSGKTTALVFKVIYDLRSGRSTKLVTLNGNTVRVPDKIWVATFLKTGAEELSDAYRRWAYRLHCPDMSQSIQFSTLHAEFKRALNAMGYVTDIIPESENKTLLRKAAAKYSLKNGNGNSLNSEDFDNLLTALTYTRNRLDKTRYANALYEEFRIIPQVVEGLLYDWKCLRQEAGKCDFEDLQEMLYDECCVKRNQNVIDYLSGRYNYIYIDEFQDTAQIQYALLKIYAIGSAQIVAIGDDDQTIYSWRGSDNSIITKKFPMDFSPTVSQLSVNFRCPEKILNAIIPSICRNTERYSKSLKAARAGGILRVGAYAGYRQMALALSDMVLEDVQAGKSVAILCRVNSDGLLPALFFDKLDKFSFSISGKNMTLESYMGRLAKSIVKLFTDKATPDVKRALELLSWDSYGVNGLIKSLKSNKGMSIWNIGEADLRYSCSQIAEKLLSWRYMREQMGDIQALRFVLSEYRTEVFQRDNSFNTVMRSVLASFESFLDYYEYADVDEFLDDLNEINERLLAREKRSKVRVRIATVHEFKGKEADSIYVWNDSKDVFPHKDSKDTYAGLEEERRVHYIACTRAREMSTVMYLRGYKGEFVDEMNLSEAEELKGETSGLVKKAITRAMEESEGLRRFEESVGVDTGEFVDSEVPADTELGEFADEDFVLSDSEE